MRLKRNDGATGEIETMEAVGKAEAEEDVEEEKEAEVAVVDGDRGDEQTNATLDCFHHIE